MWWRWWWWLAVLPGCASCAKGLPPAANAAAQALAACLRTHSACSVLVSIAGKHSARLLPGLTTSLFLRHVGLDAGSSETLLPEGFVYSTNGPGRR